MPLQAETVGRCACTRAATSLIILLLAGALLLGNAPSAGAGQQHARAVIGLGVQAKFAPHNGIAHAERHQGSKYRVAHEQEGYNYTYGNAGSGHAHHHGGGLFRPSGGDEKRVSNPQQQEIAPPRPGSPGSSQYIKQTWLPNAARDQMNVTWAPESFFQIDQSELTRNNVITSRARMVTDGGLAGTVELSAWLDRKGVPQTRTRLTGIFKDVKFELVSHPGKIVSLQFRQPLVWTVAGKVDTFDTALDGWIDVKAGRGK